MASDPPRIIRTHAGPGLGAAPGNFAELAHAVHAAGLMRRRYGYYWAKLVAVPLAFGAAATVFILIGDSWWQLLLAAALAVLLTQTAFLGHDAAHRQIFR